MLERESYPPGVPCWVDITHEDTDAATAFYGGLFGWEFEDRMPEAAPGQYFIGRVEGKDVAAIASPQPDAAAPPVWNTYVAVSSADEAAARAKDAGGRVLMGPIDVGDAGRMAELADPAGALFSVWEARGSIGAQVVNESNTWNFSGLSTTDPEGARTFYNAVFGWEVGSLGGDPGDGSGFWRMPGYGDFLEQINPGTRERMGEVQAPDGFEDAVAWLLPADDGDETQPHWNITFAVDDADAAADRATQLGGKVLVPPMDQPWVRMTVLSDPGGAVFTASKFVPPQ